METKKLKIKLSMLYLIMYAVMACFSPFLTNYLQNRNMSFTSIGIIFALNAVVGVFLQPVWGYAADKYFGKNKALVITMIGSGICILPFIFVKSFSGIILIIILYTVFSSPMWTIEDAYCCEISDEVKGIKYGKIRLMGSVGYAVMALFLGILIKKTSINLPYMVYAVLIIPSIAIVKTIKFKSKYSAAGIDISDVINILKKKSFLIFILSVMLINLCMGANGSYISVLLKNTGGDISNIGMVWFVVAISELPVFLFGDKILSKLGYINVYILCLMIFSLRYFLDSICTGYGYVIAIQIMQSVTYPLYFISTLRYISENVPARMRTSGMTLYTALGGGIGSFIGNIGGGIIIDKISIFWLFKILSIICIIDMIVVFVLKNVNKTCRHAQNIISD